MNKVEVLYATGRGVPAWEKAYADGMVPDRWPYGLHQVSAGPGNPAGYSEALPLAPKSLLKWLAASLHRRNNNYTAIAWDEDTAIRLFFEKPSATKYAGVIWATDRLLRQEFNAKDIILRRILPKFDGLWVLGRAQAEVLRNWLGRDTPPISFLPFGIDEEFFSPYEYPEKPLVLSVGRDRDRDSATLFEALEEVNRVRPDVKLAVQTTASAAVPRGVTLLPMMPHTALRKHYRAASVVAVATRPNVHVSGMTVALEAMATSRPVVISATEGMPDYVEDGISGLLVEPQNAGSMASGILGLLRDPVEAAEMGKRGRQKVELHHTTQKMAQLLSGIIQQ
ncbi:glycosyltransferase family 4 protein [Arthrobacter sp. SLBN-122]|uniref:glycosyltransferase family 4 protein n=1 Tax=Arthrobacter sp. SLBN-122 TaxID=2768455 RepID=UPI00114E0782|nr:glycosyltransferase family 4 protein [Arthrobacter sp. SLBN-122]TQJ33601.1 glycosyl transferase family 1 [Arthrobacter sp. SLBN-122]